MASTLELLQLVAESGKDVLAQYVIRNRAWSYDATRDTFVSDRSDLGLSRLDPWNRPIPDSALVASFDAEGDITYWKGHTTVEGTRISLLIYND